MINNNIMSKFDSILKNYLNEGTVTINTDTAAADAQKLKGTQLGNALGQIAGAEQQGITDPNSIKQPADIMHGVLSDDKINPLTWDKVSEQDKAKVLAALVDKKIIPQIQAQTDGEKKTPSIKDSTTPSATGSTPTSQGGDLQGSL
jgi:hypothetical protein